MGLGPNLANNNHHPKKKKKQRRRRKRNSFKFQQFAKLLSYFSHECPTQMVSQKINQVREFFYSGKPTNKLHSFDNFCMQPEDACTHIQNFRM